MLLFHKEQKMQNVLINSILNKCLLLSCFSRFFMVLLLILILINIIKKNRRIGGGGIFLLEMLNVYCTII